MSGGLGGWIASEVSGAVRRNVIIYGLYGLAGLLVLSAGGYALSAFHTVLMLRYGAIAASLWISGGLLVAGVVSVAIAVYLKNRPRPSRPMAQTALLAAPIAAKLFGSRMFGSRIGWKGGALAGIAILGLIIGRQVFQGRDDESDDL